MSSTIFRCWLASRGLSSLHRSPHQDDQIVNRYCFPSSTGLFPLSSFIFSVFPSDHPLFKKTSQIKIASIESGLGIRLLLECIEPLYCHREFRLRSLVVNAARLLRFSLKSPARSGWECLAFAPDGSMTAAVRLSRLKLYDCIEVENGIISTFQKRNAHSVAVCTTRQI